jgi:hypothetical protein
MFAFRYRPNSAAGRESAECWCWPKDRRALSSRDAQIAMSSGRRSAGVAAPVICKSDQRRFKKSGALAIGLRENQSPAPTLMLTSPRRRGDRPARRLAAIAFVAERIVHARASAEALRRRSARALRTVFGRKSDRQRDASFRAFRAERVPGFRSSYDVINAKNLL